MLEKFKQAKEGEIERLRRLADAGEMPEPLPGPRPSFHDALAEAGPAAIIAEYKRASPSKGEINTKLSCKKVAKMYARGGAAAMSVLTEETYFQGSLDYLKQACKAGLPVLRKDFIFDPLQIQATAATCASALLLIARMVGDEELRRLVALSAAAGIEPVVEIFDRPDLAKARGAGARIIQVNNRDLDTLEVNLDNSLELMSRSSDKELWISASGIEEPMHVQMMAQAGFDAVLVGTSLMASPDPEAALARLAGRR
jgi:indole-3-glycerol phosphate synthase